jgi:hypothetical protein
LDRACDISSNERTRQAKLILKRFGGILSFREETQAGKRNFIGVEGYLKDPRFSPLPPWLYTPLHSPQLALAEPLTSTQREERLRERKGS